MERGCYPCGTQSRALMCARVPSNPTSSRLGLVIARRLPSLPLRNLGRLLFGRPLAVLSGVLKAVCNTYEVKYRVPAKQRLTAKHMLGRVGRQ
jgi:hypothetical protein